MASSSVVLASGSVVDNNGGLTDPGGVVGGEWAYKTGLAAGTLPLNANTGISSTGLNVFGPGDLFPGNNLQGPASPDGVEYGIAPHSYVAGTGNGGINTEGLINDSVVITLAGNFTTADLATITNGSFQYGTSLGDSSEPNIRFVGGPGGDVPEPFSIAVWALLGATWTGVAVVRRRWSAAAYRPAWTPEARSAILSLIEHS